MPVYVVKTHNYIWNYKEKWFFSISVLNHDAADWNDATLYYVSPIAQTSEFDAFCSGHDLVAEICN